MFKSHRKDTYEELAALEWGRERAKQRLRELGAEPQ